MPRDAGAEAGSAATGPGTPASPPAGTPGSATNPLIRYPGTTHDEPSWPSWLLLLALGVTAPYLIRAAIRRDEARYVQPSRQTGQTTPAAPPATVGHKAVGDPPPPPEPTPPEPALERTPVTAQRRLD